MVVWGLVIYRIFDFTKPSDDDQVQIKNKTKVSNQVKDSLYQPLYLDYRDPFLNQMARKQEISIFKINPESKKVQWPKIIFKGYITNGNTKLVMLDLDGKSIFLNSKNSEQGLEVVTTWNDSVLIKKENEKKVFYKHTYDKKIELYENESY